MALIHADFGSADAGETAATARFLAATVPKLLAPGALVAADRDVRFADAEEMALPQGVRPGSYFFYRRPVIAAAVRRS